LINCHSLYSQLITYVDFWRLKYKNSDPPPTKFHNRTDPNKGNTLFRSLYCILAKKNFICRISGREAKALVFADSSTYSGRDDNPLFDEDDELALMSRHLGPRCEIHFFFSSRSLKTREKYISFAQLVLLSLYIF
jgi:hypothetical protein